MHSARSRGITGLAVLLAAATGCQTYSDFKKKAYDLTRSMMTNSYDDPHAEEKVARAEQLMANGEYHDAAKIFNDVAGNTYNPILLAEKARFLEAECYKNEKKYPDAVDTYHKMLVDFPGGAYRERACAEIFKIADYWLDDTRTEMQAERDGKNVFLVKMARTFSYDKTKPTLDQEGRALQALEYVQTNDVVGPTADKALFWAGYVNFYRDNFQEADHFFSLLIEMHKDSPLRPLAVELAIISKNNSTGGAVYDGQKAAEALQLVHHAEASMPEFRTEEKAAFLTRQKLAIRMQQAEKDFRMAEYYERTRHPGSAYFYYELVRRRYPGTKYADQATARMGAIKVAAEKGEYRAGPLERFREGWDRLTTSKPKESDAETAVAPAATPPPAGPQVPTGVTTAELVQPK
jgi:tetratricopeptide (TPR) repeat protein